VIWDIARVAGALVAVVVLYLIGAALVRNFARAEPPPEPGTTPLADVDYRFRCVVCNAQVVLYAAPEGEVPEPPRHCREPMMLVTPVE